MAGKFCLQSLSVSTNRVPAARHALEILKLLSTIDVPISAARIQGELGLPRSSTYHLLAEMVDAGFVAHLPEHKTYGLGLAAYSMASAYVTQQPLVRMATRDLERCADLVGGSGHLSRMAGSEILYLQEVRAAGAISLVTEVGVRLQAHKTASGRVMLAHLPDAEVRAAFDTAGGSGFSALKERLRLVAARGWDQEVEEITRGQASVAVPILDHLDRPAAAVAVTYPVGTPDAKVDAAIRALQEASDKVAGKMYRNRRK
nr:IclR family transcriptional regulator [Corynebacterium sp. ACRPJ]